MQNETPQASLDGRCWHFSDVTVASAECLLLREERKSELRGTISVFDPERTVI